MFRIHDYFYRCFQGGRNGGSMTDHPVEIIGRNSETLPLHPCDGDIRGGNPTHIFMNIKTLEGNINSVIQGVSRLVDITAWGDCLGLCDQKSSYEHMSDFGRLRRYGHLLIPVHALVWTVSYGTSWRVMYSSWWSIICGSCAVHNRAAACVADGGSIFEKPALNTDQFKLTLEAPVVLHYLKAPTAVKLTAVCFIAF